MDTVIALQLDTEAKGRCLCLLVISLLVSDKSHFLWIKAGATRGSLLESPPVLMDVWFCEVTRQATDCVVPIAIADF